jgi:hypothetical protein
MQERILRLRIILRKTQSPQFGGKRDYDMKQRRAKADV